jgi:hypothetical protein
MIHSVFEADQRERFIRPHRMLGNFGHQRDILVRGEAWHQIVELKNKSDVAPPVIGEPTIIKRCQFLVLEEQFAAAGVIQATHDVQ